MISYLDVLTILLIFFVTAAAASLHKVPASANASPPAVPMVRNPTAPQQQEAQAVGLELRPTALLLFGSPKAGTPLMQASASVALDLPLKVVAWQDDAGQVWLSYNSFAYVQARHHLSDALMQPITGSETLLRAALQPSE